MYEDMAIELARIVRECERTVERRIRERQLGEAWINLVAGETGWLGGRSLGSPTE